MSHFTREAPVTPANCPTVSKVSVVLSGLSTEEEPRDLDTENEEVLTLYDDIKKILERYTKPEVKTKQEQPSILRETKSILPCSRILKVEIERKLVTVTVMKSDGEIYQLKIQATEE